MKIPVWKIFWILIGIAAGLLAIHSFFVLSHHIIKAPLPEFLVQRFNVDDEANIPSWYSTILLFSVSVTSFFLSRLDHGLSVAGSFQRIFWLGFGILYAFLSLDEAAKLHEMIDTLTKSKWVFIYAPIMGLSFLICLYYLVVVRRKDAYLRTWIIGGLIIYALGGLAAEWIGYTYHLRYALRQIEIVAEEGLELVGTTMVLTGCLRELNILFDNKFQAK